jgi:hypothetical protein
LHARLTQDILCGSLCRKIPKDTPKGYEMAGKNIFPVPNAPLKILKLLATKKIPFVIVGGAAMALHGIPRSTIDIDIVVPAKGGAVNKLFSVIHGSKFLTRDKYITAIIDKPHLLVGQWITLQDKSGMELVDIFFENEKKYNGLSRRAKKIKGVKFDFHVASLGDIERMKRKSARAIDLADIALIREKQGKKSKDF